MKREILTLTDFLITYKSYSPGDAIETSERYMQGEFIPYYIILDITDYNRYYNDSIFSPFYSVLL